ncbi:hypothetical protein [Rosenbergiella epipactidis]|uniref:hypothetical protein n=1 Tax=Rosenbergiella epipactidis TaxID=1544694 RepID=UPI001F4D98B6
MDKKYLQVEMPDGSKWAVPVEVIALHRARYYAQNDGICLDQSLNEDTLPLFESSPFEIEDWAVNNMDWVDVKRFAVQIKNPHPDFDYEDGWTNGDKQIIEL